MATCPSMPKPHPSCQECPPAGQCRCDVDLASGAPEIQKTYLQTEHGEVSLRWFNQYDQSGSLQNPNRGLGTNWFSPSLGYVGIEDGCAVVVLSPGRGGKTHYFMAEESGYTPCYCAREQFDQLTDGTYRLADEDGTFYYFRESDHTLERVNPPGRVGETLFVYEGSQLRQQRRGYTSGATGEQTVELRYFEHNADGWISAITLQRHTNRNAQPGDADWNAHSQAGAGVLPGQRCLWQSGRPQERYRAGARPREPG